MKKIDLITPYRRGGPWYWGQNLVSELNKTGEFEASHITRLEHILLSPIISKADIVHSVNPITYHLWKKPYVLTIKGDYSKEKNNVFARFFPLATKKADIVTVPSQYLKEKLNLKNAAVIPNAIDLNTFKPISKTKNRDGSISILTVANFQFKEKSYGILNIIEAIEKLHSLKSEISYFVLGDGAYLEEIKHKAKQYNIRTNFLGRQNPVEYLQKADVFAYYSEYDNMPNAVLEAMACGLPVITNKVGAISEVIANKTDGIISSNSKDYYQYLEELVRSSETRKKLGNKAREKIKTEFNWKFITEKWLDIYRKV